MARLADASDDAAWQTFERVYQPAVYRYARSRGLQEADALEVVQDVMVAVHRAMDQWEPSRRAGSFRAWLAEAARRLTLQALRQRDKRGSPKNDLHVLRIGDSSPSAVPRSRDAVR